LLLLLRWWRLLRLLGEGSGNPGLLLLLQRLRLLGWWRWLKLLGEGHRYHRLRRRRTSAIVRIKAPSLPVHPYLRIQTLSQTSCIHSNFSSDFVIGQRSNHD
jgi:hypothetical protein